MAQFCELLDGRLELVFERIGFCAEGLDANVICLVFGDCSASVVNVSRRGCSRTLVQALTELVVSS